MGMNTVKQLERQIRDLQKELFDAKKEADLLRLQPCTGDFELRKKDEAMTEIEARVEAINQNIRELEKKRRETMSTAMKNSVYESPFNWGGSCGAGLCFKGEKTAAKAPSFWKSSFKFLDLQPKRFMLYFGRKT
jgi:hypothetical protein